MAVRAGRKTPVPKDQLPGGTRLEQRLTDKQLIFVDYYVSNNGNGKAAAIAAGADPKSAGSQASQWLNSDKYPHVCAAIERRMEERRNTSEVKATRIIQEYARIAFFDPRRLLKPDGKGVLDLRDMPDDVVAVIKNVNVTYSEDVDSEGNFVRLKHIRYELHDKLTALNGLATMLGLKDGKAAEVINNNTTNNIIVSWDTLYRNALTLTTQEADPLEAKIASAGALPARVPEALPPAPLKVVDSNEPD